MRESDRKTKTKRKRKRKNERDDWSEDERKNRER